MTLLLKLVNFIKLIVKPLLLFIGTVNLGTKYDHYDIKDILIASVISIYLKLQSKGYNSCTLLNLGIYILLSYMIIQLL